MQPHSPYQVVKPLGSSPVGGVWAAVDGAGRPLTVAVLEAHVAADHRWREAFVAAANALPPQADGRPYANADFGAPAPWVTRVADGGPGAEHLFLSLGIDYQPAVPEPPTTPQVGPLQYGPPVSGAPMSPAQPISVIPDNQPPADPFTQPYAADPFTSPTRRIEPSPPRSKRTGLWVAVAALVVVILGAGAGGYFVLNRDKPTKTEPQALTSSEPAPAITPTTLRPGLEPPRVGDWPKWPKFSAKDGVTKVTLDGVGFEPALPKTWKCNPAASGDGFVKYACGQVAGTDQVGGELIVRNCAAPCDAAEQTELRKDEEAWGGQWRFAGKNVTLAESKKIDDSSRYGLVVVAYVASSPGGALDKQVVLRMTAPQTWMNDLRRVANSVRDAAKF